MVPSRGYVWRVPDLAPRIALFAKFPTPGAVKTRLIPSIGAEAATEVHRQLVERTIATIEASGLDFAVYHTGAPAHYFSEWFGPDVKLVEQGEGDLGARLARVEAPAILLGADIPNLSPRHLLRAHEALQSKDMVIGPAQDGGYYLLGFRAPVPFLFSDMPWGTDGVLGETLARLRAREVSVEMLEELADCDRPADLALWPDLPA